MGSKSKSKPAAKKAAVKSDPRDPRGDLERKRRAWVVERVRARLVKISRGEADFMINRLAELSREDQLIALVVSFGGLVRWIGDTLKIQGESVKAGWPAFEAIAAAGDRDELHGQLYRDLACILSDPLDILPGEREEEIEARWIHAQKCCDLFGMDFHQMYGEACAAHQAPKLETMLTIGGPKQKPKAQSPKSKGESRKSKPAGKSAPKKAAAPAKKSVAKQAAMTAERAIDLAVEEAIHHLPGAETRWQAMFARGVVSGDKFDQALRDELGDFYSERSRNGVEWCCEAEGKNAYVHVLWHPGAETATFKTLECKGQKLRQRAFGILARLYGGGEGKVMESTHDPDQMIICPKCSRGVPGDEIGADGLCVRCGTAEQLAANQKPARPRKSKTPAGRTVPQDSIPAEPMAAAS